VIRAILRAQWHSMRAFRVASGRRAAVISLITGVLWYGFWTLLAAVAGYLAAQPGLRVEIGKWLPLGLLAVLLYWQLAPLASATLGASLDLRKLLLYPVPRQSLFLVEILLRIATGAEMLLLLTGAAVGLLLNPALGRGPLFVRVPVAMAFFAAFNLLLAAGLRNLIERLLNRRGIRELIAFLLMLVTILPALAMVNTSPLRRLAAVLPVGRNRWWPWTAATQVMLGAPAGAHPLACLAAVAVWTAAAYAFARWQFLRSLHYDIQEARAITPSGRRRSFTEPLYRLPALLLPDPVSAMAEKELRSLFRTPRFRMVFVMGFSFGVLVWLPMVLHGGTPHSPLADNFLTVVSVYALTLLGQVTYWNAFGLDRGAAQLYFAAPVRFSRVLAGKNIAAAVFTLLEIAAVAAACSLLRLGISPGQIGQAFLVTAIAALYLLGIGNLSSVNYPRPLGPHRVSSGGAAGRAQGLLFLFYPVALAPVFLAYLARYALDSPPAFYVILAFAAGLGVAVYWMSMESAVSAARNRREIMIAELSRGEGPMTAE